MAHPFDHGTLELDLSYLNIVITYPPLAESSPPPPYTGYEYLPSPQHHPREPASHAEQDAAAVPANDTNQKARESPKRLLSRALKTANKAVEYDHARNFLLARLNYAEAVGLLGQVIRATSKEDEKRKIERIQETYVTRIGELEKEYLAGRFTKFTKEWAGRGCVRGG